MFIPRKLNLGELLKRKSFFMFGPRGSGKTSLIREQLREQSLSIDLLHSGTFLRLTRNPSELEEIIDGLKQAKPIVVIDEIQKLPVLLDEVHRLIESRKIRFLMTGSSARKLKRGAANLLAGRAWTAHLFPLTAGEIPAFNLERYLRYGGFPAVHLSSYPDEELDAYVSTYMQEEIRTEGLVRDLTAFSDFLRIAALSNGQLLNFSQIASDTGVSDPTIREYYAILEDTLLGSVLKPWKSVTKRKTVSKAKFYLCDPGIVHTLAQTRTIDRNSELYGRSFEQWVYMELKAYVSYRRTKDPICFWQTDRHQYEVDFIIGDHTALEVKATKRVNQKDLRSLQMFSEEEKLKGYYLVSQDPIERKVGAINCIHWKSFIAKLWAGELDDRP